MEQSVKVNCVEFELLKMLDQNKYCIYLMISTSNTFLVFFIQSCNINIAEVTNSLKGLFDAVIPDLQLLNNFLSV